MAESFEKKALELWESVAKLEEEKYDLEERLQKEEDGIGGNTKEDIEKFVGVIPKTSKTKKASLESVVKRLEKKMGERESSKEDEEIQVHVSTPLDLKEDDLARIIKPAEEDAPAGDGEQKGEKAKE